MKNLKEYIKEGLFDDLEEIEKIGGMESNVKLLKKEIEKWIKENYNYTGTLEISNKPNRDGLYEVIAISVEVKNKNITSFTNGFFVWKEVRGYFDCSRCKSLKYLTGAPKKVIKSFYCRSCKSLKSLEGAPKEVGGDFICSYCTSLESLEGASKEVGGDFICYNCSKLESLKGAPKKVEGTFDCQYCTSLTSLEGAPKEVGRNFDCYSCKKQFTKDDIKKISNVKREIYC